MLIRKWLIYDCGWDVYLREVAELTRGRRDVYVKVPAPGVVMLYEGRSYKEEKL